MGSGRSVRVTATSGLSSQILSLPVDDPPFFEPVVTNPGLLVFTHPTGTQTGVLGKVALYPTSGSGAPVVLPGDVLPAFVSTQIGHLPISGWQGQDRGLGQVAQPFTWGWFGSEIVYEARTVAMAGLDLVAATDDVATVGVIAGAAEVWAVRDAPKPKRVFFTHAAHAAHDGVWTSRLPQTPGR